MGCLNQVPFCKAKCCACDHVGCEQECPLHKLDCGGETVPTFGQWIGIWLEAAEKRRIESGSENTRMLKTRLYDLQQFMSVMGYTDEDKVSVVTRKTVGAFVDRVKDRYSSDTLHCKVESLKSVFDRWLRRMFEDVWDLPMFDKPDLPPRAKVIEVPAKLLLAVKLWYRSLSGRKMFHQVENKDRMFIMFMYRFAMRNGDVARLRWSNIENIDGRLRLHYVPHKTYNEKKRQVREVKAWIDGDLDRADIMAFREACGNPPDDAFIFGGGKCIEMQDRLRAEMRELGFTGSKSLYWLRKICLTDVYKRLGREAVYALSGDNTDDIIFGHYVPKGSYDISVGDVE